MPNDDDSDRSPRAAPLGGSRARGSRTIMVQSRVRRVSGEARAQELEARKRVAALASGGLHLHVKERDGHVQAARGAAAAKLCARLTSKAFAPEQTIDLRSTAEADMDGAIAGFLRVVHRRGVKHVRIVFADQSDDARQAAVVLALTRGAPAPLVRAFATPHEAHGGTTALAVLLV